MAYIGRDITSLSNAAILDAITFSDSAGPYNLTQSTVAFTPISAQALVISIDGVIQSPSSYTISAATITFDSTMSSSATNDFIVHNGVGLVTEPSDDAVTTAKIKDDAVTTVKILDNNVTVAKLPTTLNISGNTVTLPASVSGLGTGITNAQLAGSIDVTSKITGVVPSANLGSGTASSSTYLAGDSTYKTITTGTSWQSVETGSTMTAVAGNGYPIDTTSNACTVTLPAGSVGDTIELVDYAGTWDTNNVTLTANGSEKIKGSTNDLKLTVERQGIKIVYVDATQGWEAITGVNETAPALNPLTYSVDFLVVAGGGGSARQYAGGGGAGGYRTSTQTVNQGTTITVTVGDGGPAIDFSASAALGVNGDDSSISGSGLTTITSTGGGGSDGQSGPNGSDGGSGGGGGNGTAGGSGNTPNTDPSQGNDGGDNTGASGGAGGGGHAGAGADNASYNGSNGGAGTDSSISGSSVGYAGGGGGGRRNGGGSTVAGTASHGGGAGTAGTAAATAGTVNTGGGGGGASGGYSGGANGQGGDGGKGVVVLSMPDASYSSTTTGSPTVATGQGGGSDTTTLVFTGDGTYTA